MCVSKTYYLHNFLLVKVRMWRGLIRGFYVFKVILSLLYTG